MMLRRLSGLELINLSGRILVYTVDLIRRLEAFKVFTYYQAVRSFASLLAHQQQCVSLNLSLNLSVCYLNTFLTLSTACRAHEAQDSKDSYSYHQEDLFERFTTGLPETPICLKHHVLKQQKATTFALTGNRDKMFSIL